MSPYLLVYCLFIIFQPPDWLDYNTRNLTYPQDDFFMGFSSRYYEEGEDLNEVIKEVKHLSRMELSESVFINVNSQSVMKLSTQSGSTETSYEKSSMTSSSLEAFGMKTETFLDENEKVAYGFSFIKKKALAGAYFKKFYAKMAALKAVMKQAELEIRPIKKYDLLTEGMTLLHEMDAGESMLIFLRVSPSVLMGDDRKYSKSVIREQFNIIRSSEDQTISQRIQYLVDDMANELQGQNIIFSVSPVTYKNTGITSEFSDYLHQITNARISNKFQVSLTFNSDFRLTGTYWPSKEGIQLTINLHEYEGEEPLFQKFGGSLTVGIEEVRRLGLAYELKDDGIDLKKHYDILNPPTANGGMEASILTHKGAQALIFKEGESLKLFVNVSRPAYLRLVNIWSDGTQLSLLENYFVRKEKTNQLIELPFDWQTACPCGTEYIKLLAQSDPFPRINIVSKDGLDYIQENISEVLQKTRGFQQSQVNSGDFYFAESGFSVTTLPKN